MCPVGRSCSYEERQEFARFPFFTTPAKAIVVLIPSQIFHMNLMPATDSLTSLRYDEEHGVRDAFKTELEKVSEDIKIHLICLHSEVWSLGPSVCQGRTDLHRLLSNRFLDLKSKHPFLKP